MRRWIAVFALMLTNFIFAQNLLVQEKPILVGLLVNGKEVASVDAYHMRDNYFLPFDLVLEYIGIAPIKEEQGWRFNTPLGSGLVFSKAVESINHQKYIELSALKGIGVNAFFDQSAYAINMVVPWDKTKLHVDSVPKNVQKIDYFPQTVGIKEISFDGDYTWQRNEDNDDIDWNRSLSLGTSGNLFGGVWGNELRWYDNSDNSESKDVYVKNLYWTDSGAKTAWRLGLNTPAYDTGGSEEFTGVAFAYSNESIERHLNTLNSGTSSLLSSSYQDYRTIRGEGPAGGVAELRVNGRAIARVRIALDKRYSFKHLNMNRLHDNKDNVEIALYEHSLNTPPTKIISYRLGKRRANVGTGEFLFESGAGQVGNVFNNEYREKGHYIYSYAEYGLNNNIALRVGLSDSEVYSTTGTIGINVGLSPNLNWDTAYWEDKDKRRFETEMGYDNEVVNFNYHFQQDDDKKNNKKTQNHRLYTHIRPNDKWNFSTTGYYETDEQGLEDKYFTATLNARFSDTLDARLHRDGNNDYSYRLDWRPDYNNTLGMHGDEDKDGVYVRHRFNQHTTIGGSVQKERGESDLFYQAYVEHDFSEKNDLYFGYSRYRSHDGYQFDWRYKANRGLNFYLGYRKNDVGFDYFIDDVDDELPDREYAYLRFRLDLSNTPGAGYQFKSHRYSNKGTILADIQFDEEMPVNDEKIALQLNRHQVPAQKLADGKYLIENISAGVYALSLDNKNLPIEYSTQALPEVTIKVDKASTTVVPYQLQKTLGVSGKLADGTSSITISAYRDGEKISSTQSNAFGYYQLLGLTPADYEIRALGYQTRAIKLDEAFLFEVDLEK